MRYVVAIPLMACHRCGRSFNLGEWRALSTIGTSRLCRCGAKIADPGVELEQRYVDEEDYRLMWPDGRRGALAVPETARERFSVALAAAVEWLFEAPGRAWRWVGRWLGT